MANKETDIIIENQNMQIELTDYITFWSSIIGLPSSNTALVEYLNILLATKQDLTYYVVATEADKESIPSKKTGTVAFVKATKNLYIYYVEDTTTEWIMLIRDLSNYYTKSETDTLLALKANIADVYSKIDADARFATITNLNAEATTRASEDTSIRESIKNGKLTIQKNGYTVAEFYANQAGDTTANIVADTPAWGNISGNIQTQTDLQQEFTTKQPNLTSANAGTGISITGSGSDVIITNTQTSAEWGNITGTLSNQTDLQNALDLKANQSALTSEINDRQEADADLQEEINTLTETVDNKVTKNNAIVGSTKTKITYDSKGLVTLGEDLSASDIPNLTLSKITDVSATATELNILNGATINTTELNYLDGTTSNIQTQINSKLNITDVINNVTTTTTNQALSANMGKELQDQITNLKQRGRYLSIWNCTTGLATTTPTVNPYTYKAGDYFIVGITGETNYKPTGSTYDKDVPSTVVETEDVIVNDTYYYDGTTWSLLHTSQPTVAFSTLAGSPYDNANLTTALNAKVTANNAITAGTNCKITYDSKGLVTGGTSLEATDIPNLNLSKIIDVTATASEVNVLDGITATTTELNYCDGVTSNIQTQLNSKQASLPTLIANTYLTNNGSTLSWGSVVDDTSTTSTTKSWSASKLNTTIGNIEALLYNINSGTGA